MKREARPISIGAAASALLFVLLPGLLPASKRFDVRSPDGSLRVNVTAGDTLRWSVLLDGKTVLLPSAVSLRLADGTAAGAYPVVLRSEKKRLNNRICAVNYVKACVPDTCGQLTLELEGGWGLIFRAYNDGAAYRFFMKRAGDIVVRTETAEFNFAGDTRAFIPYMRDYRDGLLFNCSFESPYREIPVSRFAADSLAFLPVLVDAGGGRKAVILEADLEDYPGLSLARNAAGNGFRAVHAPVPLEVRAGGYSGMNLVPTRRADCIAKTAGPRPFPWRVLVVSRSDRELLDNDMVQRLAAPCRLKDVSWIKPGQVAWDWWNDWNVSRVDFRAGINTPTYKAYIDFAAANGVAYIIMDAGWSPALDLLTQSDGIDVREITEYGRERGVGVILWASWAAVLKQMDEAFPLYAGMGVKGFKIDFFDRDDQAAVASTYDIARRAAEHGLMVDFHGIFKPTGLQRTWPNVVGYEGVMGLEYCKWAVENAPHFDVCIPFIRQLAGPMDYTPGAMRNAARPCFRPVNGMPMSQGTRCHQLAMYAMFYAPLQMLSDSPTAYGREPECADFIVRIPTTFDETAALAGAVGEYAAVGRRKGNAWYVGVMTDWTPREVAIDFAFLKGGDWDALIFSDGVNADRDGTDYRREVRRVRAGDRLRIRLASGGGWAAILTPAKERDADRGD